MDQGGYFFPRDIVIYPSFEKHILFPSCNAEGTILFVTVYGSFLDEDCMAAEHSDLCGDASWFVLHLNLMLFPGALLAANFPSDFGFCRPILIF